MYYTGLTSRSNTPGGGPRNPENHACTDFRRELINSMGLRGISVYTVELGTLGNAFAICVIVQISLRPRSEV